jgi:hypothetical protein
MTESEFNTLARQGYNRIPLMAQAFADLETPLSLYLKLAFSQNSGRNTFLLESVVGGNVSAATASLACRRARWCAPAVLARMR